MNRSIPRRRGRHAWKVLLLVAMSACKECDLLGCEAEVYETRLPDPNVLVNLGCPLYETVPYTPSGEVGALVDLDGDGRVERIGLGMQNGLDVGRQLGTAFTQFSTVSTPPNTLLFDVAAAHLRDPQRADLLVTTADPLAPGGEAYGLRVYEQLEDGTFAMEDEAYAGLSNGTMLVDRFASSTPVGLDDVAIHAPAAGPNPMRVYANDGAGGLTGGGAPRLEHHYAAASGRIAPGDPGLADVLVQNARPSGLLPVWNQRLESGVALSASGLTPRGFSSGLALEDLDGDGLDDLVVFGGGALAIGRNVCGDEPSACAGLPSLDSIFAEQTLDVPESSAFAVADLDGDGLRDLLTVTPSSDRLRLDVFLQRDGFTFMRRFLDLGRTMRPHALRVGDVDGDGRDDVVVEGRTAGSGEALGGLIGAVYAHAGPAARWDDADEDGRVDACTAPVTRQAPAE